MLLTRGQGGRAVSPRPGRAGGQGGSGLGATYGPIAGALGWAQLGGL